MSDNRIHHGKRIKYEKQDDKYVSFQIYSNGAKMVRIHLDPDKMEYKLVDPVTGFVFETGGNVTNFEVLQRKAKKAIKKFLNIHFAKEERNVRAE